MNERSRFGGVAHTLADFARQTSRLLRLHALLARRAPALAALRVLLPLVLALLVGTLLGASETSSAERSFDAPFTTAELSSAPHRCAESGCATLAFAPASDSTLAKLASSVAATFEPVSTTAQAQRSNKKKINFQNQHIIQRQNPILNVSHIHCFVNISNQIKSLWKFYRTTISHSILALLVSKPPASMSSPTPHGPTTTLTISNSFASARND